MLRQEPADSERNKVIPESAKGIVVKLRECGCPDVAIAKAMGVTQPAVSQWATGKRVDVDPAVIGRLKELMSAVLWIRENVKNTGRAAAVRDWVFSQAEKELTGFPPDWTLPNIIKTLASPQRRTLKDLAGMILKATAHGHGVHVSGQLSKSVGPYAIPGAILVPITGKSSKRGPSVPLTNEQANLIDLATKVALTNDSEAIEALTKNAQMFLRVAKADERNDPGKKPNGSN